MRITKEMYLRGGNLLAHRLDSEVYMAGLRGPDFMEKCVEFKYLTLLVRGVNYVGGSSLYHVLPMFPNGKPSYEHSFKELIKAIEYIPKMMPEEQEALKRFLGRTYNALHRLALVAEGDLKEALRKLVDAVFHLLVYVNLRGSEYAKGDDERARETAIRELYEGVDELYEAIGGYDAVEKSLVEANPRLGVDYGDIRVTPSRYRAGVHHIADAVATQEKRQFFWGFTDYATAIAPNDYCHKGLDVIASFLRGGDSIYPTLLDYEHKVGVDGIVDLIIEGLKATSTKYEHIRRHIKEGVRVLRFVSDNNLRPIFETIYKLLDQSETDTLKYDDDLRDLILDLTERTLAILHEKAI